MWVRRWYGQKCAERGVGVDLVPQYCRWDEKGNCNFTDEPLAHRGLVEAAVGVSLHLTHFQNGASFR